MPTFTPPGVDEIEGDQPSFTPPAPDEIEQPAVSVDALLAGRPHIKPGWIDPIEKERAELGLPQPVDQGPFEVINRKAVEPIGAALINAFTPKKKVFVIDTRPNPQPLEMHEEDAVKPGVPMVEFTPDPVTGEMPFGKKMISGMTTPGQAVTLPLAMLAPESRAGKAIEALYGGSMAESIPGQVKEAIVNKDKEAAENAITQTLMLGAMAKGFATEKGPLHASRQQEAAALHGDVRAQQPPAEGVPAQESGGGVQPQTQAVAEEGKVPLNIDAEHQKQVGQHLEDYNGVVVDRPESGRVMQANHETGQIEVNKADFEKWVNEDLSHLSPEDRAKAIKSYFEHEDIHLKTSPEDAEPFWNSLSPFEQWVVKRTYLKGGTDTPRNLGFEAIRQRMERAMGLTRSDFVDMAVHQRWTAKSLEFMANIVDKIRRFKDRELSTHQKDILDRVKDNLDNARNVITENGVTVEAGPFSRRQEEEPGGPEEGTTRLYRGHDGGNGGVYWSKDKAYASRMGPKLEYLDVPTKDLSHYTEAGNGTPNAFKLPADLTKEAKPLGLAEQPVHNLDNSAEALLEKKPGEATVPEVLQLPDDEVKRWFEGNQKRKNALQHDAVLQGMKLLPEDAGPLKQIRDRLHQEGMRKLAEGLARGDESTPVELGKVIWLNGVIEGAERRGPNYESVTTARRNAEGPAARRKQGKPGEQEEMFKGMSPSGIPGQEWTQGRESVPINPVPSREPTITPEKIAFDEPRKLQQAPFRPITASEVKGRRVAGKPLTRLDDILTADARIGGSDLPVSSTRRVTAMMDNNTGQIHLVSTYKGDGVARMVDPDAASSKRPNRPVSELLGNYTPVYTMLLKEPVQNFHEVFGSMADFQDKMVTPARDIMNEMGTRTAGIPITNMESAEPGQLPSIMQREREPNFARPTEQELRDIYDFFGDNLPNSAEWFGRRLENASANASRGLINALRKLMKIEQATHRGMSEGEALGNVIDRLYENTQATETRDDFVKRTMGQSRITSAERDAQIRLRAAEAERIRKSGARNLTALTFEGPKQPPTGTGVEATEGVAATKPEYLSHEEREKLYSEIEKSPEHNVMTPERSAQLMKSIAESPVQKERYTVGGYKPIEQPFEELPQEEQDAIEEAIKELDYDRKRQIELFPERKIMGEKPEAQVSEEGKEVLTKAARETKGRTKDQPGMRKAEEKAQSTKRQLDFWENQGPAARRNMRDTVDKVSEYLRRTKAALSTAGSIADRLYRLKTSEKADFDLAVPVIKSALKSIPPEDRAPLLQYADEMQVLGKSSVKLTDAQRMLYETFIEPVHLDNQHMFKLLTKAGVPVGESTYMSRVVQDTQSLYSRLWRGAKRRAVEGALLGQTASFFKKRVFKALEDDKGNRQVVALVGSGKDTRVVAYDHGKPTLLGKMPPDSLEVKPLSERQLKTQRIVDARRQQEIDALDREERRLTQQREQLAATPESTAANAERIKQIDERLSGILGEHVRIEEAYPQPTFETPRYWKDKAGKEWKFTDATIGEIEGNTDTRYYKEPMSGVITQHLKLKQIFRANQLLEDLKNSEDFKRFSRSARERNIPEKWRQVDLQQFRGLMIEPRIADELDLFAEQQRGPSVPLQYVNNVVRFLRNSLFIWNPFVHEPNLLSHWFTARGAEWIKPDAYKRMVTSGVQAFTDVLTKSRFRDQALREGAPLMRGMDEMNKQMLNLLEKEFQDNPNIGRKVAKALGYVNPFRMVRAFGDSLTWGTNEILTLQLIRETMARTGMSMGEAISEVGKHMPNYRIPARVLNSRFLSHVMRNPVISLWGHYHYGALRSYGEMAKEMFSPKSDMQTRLDALGRVATIGFLMEVAYPLIDKLIEEVMGKKGYHIRRAGPTTLPQNLIDVAEKKKTPEAALQSVITPSPAMTVAPELWFNRSLRSGMPIYERRLGLQTGKDLLGYGLEQISPIGEGEKVSTGEKSLKETGLGMMGINYTKADSAISQFGRLTDKWMKDNVDPRIREAYKRRTQDVFTESDYQKLRSAVVRGDYHAGQMMMEELLKTRKPSEIAQRIEQWQHSPFTGTRRSDRLMMSEMTPDQWDLWYQAAQERQDIAHQMRSHLFEAVLQSQSSSGK